MEWVGKSIRFLLWLLCNSITAVPLGPKATTISQEVQKKGLWNRAVVDKGKILLLCIPDGEIILWIMKRAGVMYWWHWGLGGKAFCSSGRNALTVPDKGVRWYPLSSMCLGMNVPEAQILIFWSLVLAKCWSWAFAMISHNHFQALEISGDQMLKPHGSGCYLAFISHQLPCGLAADNSQSSLCFTLTLCITRKQNI